MQARELTGCSEQHGTFEASGRKPATGSTGSTGSTAAATRVELMVGSAKADPV